ncbi:endonuclease III domain-containing protein, partial [Halobellus sp. EA9]|uniref:endonuclease III domain-containing protein n=1 Tax=Halobellus sp. EA9 TaxID=3421647 RepID=UPI003EB8C4BD
NPAKKHSKSSSKPLYDFTNNRLPNSVPVDTHVHRIARRMGLAPADADHETVREHLEADVPGEKCGFGHTAMIQFGREYCSARKPACLDGPEACPLYDLCDRVGVDEMAESVVDPAEVAGD